ncbi:hypothetical protein GE09DRAFT_750748 [Coniochaeta sp. 2T2.1]|nr:hypothetical protein GE09DRAFT_750748 [Coniochaeta sp. 2T2.1]
MASTSMSIGRPTLIHLQDSSSQIILWALEELGIDYDLHSHPRPAKSIADLEALRTALKKTHPLGKAPQLILADGGRVLTQQSAILFYLRETYDKGGDRRVFSHPENTEDVVREQYLIGLARDIDSKVGAKLMFHGMSVLAPFVVRPVLNFVRRKADAVALDPDIGGIFAQLEAELEKGGREWFMGGDRPSCPDVLLKYFVDLTVQSGYVDLRARPRIKGWLERCEAREAWKRGLEKGNGYDLDWPGKW